MKNRAHGFTLIELMTVMLILAILMAIAIPSFRDFAADSRTSAVTSDLVTALNLARSEALHRSSNVVACASDDLAKCNASNTWDAGFIVFLDSNSNGVVDGTDVVLQTWAQSQTDIEARANGPSAVYNSQGMAVLPPGKADLTLTVKRTGCTGDRAKQIVMSIMGSLQTTKVTC
jgi:type IV fimbrial biogenesis protein FimT